LLASGVRSGADSKVKEQDIARGLVLFEVKDEGLYSKWYYIGLGSDDLKDGDLVFRFASSDITAIFRLEESYRFICRALLTPDSKNFNPANLDFLSEPHSDSMEASRKIRTPGMENGFISLPINTRALQSLTSPLKPRRWADLFDEMKK
jgi:hypothetical protein